MFLLNGLITSNAVISVLQLAWKGAIDTCYSKSKHLFSLTSLQLETALHANMPANAL